MSRALEASAEKHFSKKQMKPFTSGRNFAVEQERKIKEKRITNTNRNPAKNPKFEEEQMNIEIAVQEKRKVFSKKQR